MNLKLKSALGATAILLGSQAMAQITLYEHDGFRGQALSTDRRMGDLVRQGFNDRVSSIVVERGRWEVCEDSRFEGRCVILRRGSYDSMQPFGMNDRISSVRPVERGQGRDVSEVPPPMETPNYAWRRR